MDMIDIDEELDIDVDGDEKARHHLTPSQERLLGIIAYETAVNGAARYTKQQLAGLIRKDVKTVDRAVSRMKREGLIETEMRFSDDGRQLSSAYRVVAKAKN